MTQVSRPSWDKVANQVTVAGPAIAVLTPLAAPVVEPATTSSIAKRKPLLMSAADHVTANVLATENVVAWPTIKLTAIIGGPHIRSFARVNGKLVTLGDTVESMPVAAISTQGVTLICKGQHRDFYVGDRDDCK